MPKDDFLAHASNPIDFYALLGVAFETSESDIRRAYRKTALKYHPDKLGAAFDPDKFHLLQVANDVLSDPAAKAAYDAVRSARRQKERQNELFEGRRRQMKEELEARERGGGGGMGTVRVDGVGGKRMREEMDEEGEMEREVRRLAEEGKRRRMEMERQMREQGGVSAPTTASASTTKASPPESVSQPASTSMPAAAPPEMSDPSSSTQTASEEAAEEDEVAQLERRIHEAQAAKARRKADKRAKRKSEAFLPSETSSTSLKVPFSTTDRWGKDHEETEPASQAREKDLTKNTPGRRHDPYQGLRTEDRPPPASAPPKFSFAPSAPTFKTSAFADTMERLKRAEKERLEAEIRKQDAAAAVAAATTAQ